MFSAATLVPIAFILGLAFVLVGVRRVISDGRPRRRLIEAGATPELARAVPAVPNDDLGLSGTLRWGLVTGAVGLGLIVIQFLPFRSDEPIALGVILVFAAAGLLTYYARARAYQRDRKSTRLNSSHGYISYAVFCLKKKRKK